MVHARCDLLIFSRKDVMNRDKSDTTTHSLEALSNFRGIFKRVALQLDVDPSYVSRVARGERHAPYVSGALRKEIQRVLGKAGLHNGAGPNHDGAGHNHDGAGHNGDQTQGLDPVSPDGYSINGSADGARHAVNGHHPAKTVKSKKVKKNKAPAARARKS
jgi:hypothetical protein